MRIEIKSPFKTFEDLVAWLQAKKISYTSVGIRHEDGFVVIEIPLPPILSTLKEKGIIVSIVEEAT